MGIVTAVVGVGIFVLGLLSARYVEPDVYRDFLAGYDPPFDWVSGALLIALSFRLSERGSVAWLFALIAPALTIFIAVLSPNVYSISAAGAATALVAVIYPYRAGFYRGSASGPQAVQTLIFTTALLTILVGMVGARWLSSEFSPPIGGWADTLYFTVATISTNGSNFVPTTDTARLFVVVLILLGVGTFLTAVVVLFAPFLERRLVGVAARLERAQMEDLAQHVVVCGDTPAARATCDVLRDRGIRSVLLSDDSKVVELLRNEGYRVHLGAPSSEEDLRAVGIDRARAIVVAQPSDAESLLTVITVRGMYPDLRIVAVATAPESAAKLRKAGANEAINLVTVAASLASSAVLDHVEPPKSSRP